MDRAEMFRNLMVMAAADRKFTDEEVELLALRASRWGLTDAQFDQAVAYAADGNAELTLPDNDDERRQMLRDLLQVMAADGELAPAEKQLFAEAAGKMGVSADELNAMIDALL